MKTRYKPLIIRMGVGYFALVASAVFVNYLLTVYSK